jgi:hypothetical protein
MGQLIWPFDPMYWPDPPACVPPPRDTEGSDGAPTPDRIETRDADSLTDPPAPAVTQEAPPAER